MSTSESEARIALVGHPNAGKTTLFNLLTGQRQKVGNYTGVTVDRVSGEFFTPHGHRFELIDLPGCYSLEPNSPDEKVTRDFLYGEQVDEVKPDLVVCVLDASALERHLTLLKQVLQLRLPVVVALNKIDQAEGQGIRINLTSLSETFGVTFVPISALTERGVTSLKQALRHPFPPVDDHEWTKGDDFSELLIDGYRRPDEETLLLSDQIDAQVLHPVKGWFIFGAMMMTVFWTIFRFAEIPMGWIESAQDAIAGWVSGMIAEGDFHDLMVDGVIGGVGSVVIFLPQILLLFFFISLLESSGYMSRAAYLMDGVMSKVGLSGKSFLPLLSGYACAIPGVMATRTIPSAKERLATILILPWTSCTARLPVYFLLVPLLVTGSGAQTLTLFGIYALGTFTALLAGKFLRPRLGKVEASQFMLELPPYQKPHWGFIFRQVLDRGWAFLKKAGTLILGISILLWFLETYPKSDSDDPLVQREASFMGKAGKVIEPVVRPLGWDSRLGTAMLTSFAAREVFVSSLSISYSVDEENEEAEGQLRDQLAAAKKSDGSPLFGTFTVLSLLIFYMYALQCLPTTAVVKRETNSWKWALGQLGGMTLFAYLAALLVYQLGTIFG